MGIQIGSRIIPWYGMFIVIGVTAGAILGYFLTRMKHMKFDEFIELATICPCGKKARFNARLVNGNYTDSGNVIEIDGSNSSIEYEPLCGKCYYKKIMKNNNKYNI